MSAPQSESDNGQRRRSRGKRPRSAITSGRKLFVTGNPNSAWSRRYHDLIAGHCADLGGGPQLSEAQLSIIRRAAAMECELERLEGLLSAGETINLDEFTRTASHLRRLYESLGLNSGRKQRDVTSLTLHDFVSEFDQAKASAARLGVKARDLTTVQTRIEQNEPAATPVSRGGRAMSVECWRSMLIRQRISEAYEARWSAFTVDRTFHGNEHVSDLLWDARGYYERGELDAAERCCDRAEAATIRERLPGAHGMAVEPGLIGWGVLKPGRELG